VKIYNDIAQVGKRAVPTVLAVGTFDGVHAGHRAVVGTARQCAQRLRGEVWALTFDPHPLRVVHPAGAPPLLTSLAHKLRLLETLEVNGCIVIPFTRAFAAVGPREFIDRLMQAAPNVREIVVGGNWTFGRGGEGNVDLLRRESGHHGYRLTVADPMLWQGAPISSTRIRDAVGQGRLDEARQMLGRPFSILGEVVAGHRMGRELGFPTANIASQGEVVPPQGIYAVYALINGQRHDGAAYFGTRPSFKDDRHEPVLEVHLFDGRFDLYTHEIEVFFVRFLREDRTFDDLHALQRQIREDCASARCALRDDAAAQDGPVPSS